MKKKPTLTRTKTKKKAVASKKPVAKKKVVRKVAKDNLTKKKAPRKKTSKYVRRSGKDRADVLSETPQAKIEESQEEDIAYVLTDDVAGVINVKNSANAWWLDKVKVSKVFDAYKLGCTDVEACIFAGITHDKLRYFREQHDEFSRMKDQCLEFVTLRSRINVAGAIQKGSVEDSWRYLTLKKGDEFNTKSRVEQSGGLTHKFIEPEKKKKIDRLLGSIKGLAKNYEGYSEPRHD